MEDGVNTVNGQSARLNVEEEPRLGPELAVILPQPMGALIVRDKTMSLRIAPLFPVQVNRCWT